MSGNFYDGRAVFESPIEYQHLESEPEKSKSVFVELMPFVRSSVAAAGTGAFSLWSAAAYSTPSTVDPRIFVATRAPFPAVPVPAAHQRMGARFKKLFREIPLSPSEKIADPDYGL